ncbi:MAG: PAS domain S-box protein, partial [Acidimicrobiales bacterium]
MVSSVLLIGLGQLAIATGLVPTLVAQPFVHGLAGLALVGVLFTIKLLDWLFRAREEIEADLVASERRFKALVRHAADLIVVTDAQGALTYASPAFEGLLGYEANEITSLQGGDLTHPEDLARVEDAFQTPESSAPGPVRFEARLKTVAGDWVWFDVTVTNLLNDPDVGGMVANLRDISENKRAEAARLEAEQRFRSSFEEAPIGMALVDNKGRYLHVNRAFGLIVGREPAALVGVRTRDLTHPEDREASAVELRRQLDGEIDSYHLEKRYLHSDGHVVWASLNSSCVRDKDGKPLYVIGQVEDITERRAMREWMAHAAIHDSLTDLPNRALLMDRLEVALHHADRKQSQIAVIFLDLDHFKLINDSFGHEGGDVVLRAVAQRVHGSVRPEDTVARIGGDEFIVLCEEVPDESSALEIAQRVSAAFDAPFSVSGLDVYVTASVGLSMSKPSQDSPASVLRNADSAMYRAKERGRGSIEVYTA